MLKQLYLLTISTLVLFSCCTLKNNEKEITIALSYGDANSSYGKWIKSQDSCINIINLYSLPVDSVQKALEKCNGLLLTGGADVNPCIYNQPADTLRCYMHDRRDTIEINAIKKALKLKLPVLGVCRGEQILNVALGGSLIIDIPTDVNKDIIHRKSGTYKCFHDINIIQESILGELSEELNVKVNSRHHQAVNRISDQLKAIAYSTDGVIEAIQWKENSDKSFLLGVQWHPEQMGDKNKLSERIIKRFISEVKKY